MARSGKCGKCGATIRPRAKDMSVGAASRLHYWRHHPEVMLAGQAKREWGSKRSNPKRKARR
ncbi:MAG: hypothetical protein ACRDKJ_04430 [Actinomycetota bacterium]